MYSRVTSDTSKIQIIRLCNMIVNALANSVVDMLYLCLTSIISYSVLIRLYSRTHIVYFSI